MLLEDTSLQVNEQWIALLTTSTFTLENDFEKKKRTILSDRRPVQEQIL